MNVKIDCTLTSANLKVCESFTKNNNVITLSIEGFMQNKSVHMDASRAKLLIHFLSKFIENKEGLIPTGHDVLVYGKLLGIVVPPVRCDIPNTNENVWVYVFENGYASYYSMHNVRSLSDITGQESNV